MITQNTTRKSHTMKSLNTYEIFDDYGGYCLSIREMKKLLKLVEKTPPGYVGDIGTEEKEMTSEDYKLIGLILSGHIPYTRYGVYFLSHSKSFQYDPFPGSKRMY